MIFFVAEIQTTTTTSTTTTSRHEFNFRLEFSLMFSTWKRSCLFNDTTIFCTIIYYKSLQQLIVDKKLIKFTQYCITSQFFSGIFIDYQILEKSNNILLLQHLLLVPTIVHKRKNSKTESFILHTKNYLTKFVIFLF